MPSKKTGPSEKDQRPGEQKEAVPAQGRPGKKRAERVNAAGAVAPAGGKAGGSAARTPDAAPFLALFERIGAREEKALAKLYDLTVGRVYGLALRIARNEAAAEEIAEDVFLQVWKSVASYSQERGHPLAWMMVITRSRALDYLRREDPAQAHPEPETLADYADTSDDPQDLLLALEAGSALHAALARLPALQRQLLALAFFQGLSHSEIASHAQLPLGTVKTHLRRALLSLRATLA